MHQTAPAHSRIDWQTPDGVLELVRKLGPIRLDPCTSIDNPCQAKEFYTSGGLEADWRGDGIVYVNPPYGRGISAWLRKCDLEAENGCEIVILVSANTDTLWYDFAKCSSEAACEVRGRLRFKGADAPAKFASALFYWGKCPFWFAHVFSEIGRCYVR